MLGVDQLTQERWRREALNGAARERRQQLLADNIKAAEVTVESDEGRDVSKLSDQLGRFLTAQAFIDKLKKCNNKLTFIKHPLYDMYGIYIEREGRQIHVCGMPASIVPEFTVVEKVKTQVPNPELLGTKKPIREVAWKEIETTRQILLQGWRTILLRLLNARLISEYHVRKHFSWQPSKPSRKWAEATR